MGWFGEQIVLGVFGTTLNFALASVATVAVMAIAYGVNMSRDGGGS